MKITPNVEVISYTLELSEQQLRVLALLLDYVAIQDAAQCMGDVIVACDELFGYPKLGTVEFDIETDPQTMMIRIRGEIEDHFEYSCGRKYPKCH